MTGVLLTKMRRQQADLPLLLENEDILQAFWIFGCYNRKVQGGKAHEERNENGSL